MTEPVLDALRLNLAPVIRKLYGLTSSTTNQEIAERLRSDRIRTEFDGPVVDCLFRQFPDAKAPYDAGDATAFALALGVDLTPASLPSTQDEIDALKKRVASLEVEVAALAGRAI